MGFSFIVENFEDKVCTIEDGKLVGNSMPLQRSAQALYLFRESSETSVR